MTTSSSTVSAIALQINQMRGELDDLKAVMLGILKEVLQTAQMQAEANRELTRAIAAQAAMYAQNQGGGRSRVTTESDEYAQWRAELDERDRVTNG